jgi:3-hydroxyacyl-CoA dehydrogenase
MNSLQTIGVIGAGTMGSGSAQVCAHAGTSVSITDVNEQRVARLVSCAATRFRSRHLSYTIPTKCRRFADDSPHFFDYAGTT